ncbi:MAG TPA: DegT/DnrJ/EryC1/StrS family aminotransferase, partial [Thermoanaerobaculia bacterium]|nr:DegT/DnrJ/EryC1/StrS family aminotransferase [Thermoanaerobaculia bacterium]
LDLPPGSEVLMSALTIRDMVRIVDGHGLVPVPVDLDPRTLAVSPEALARAVSPKTRAIVVAHLFGSRMPMEPVVRFARERNLFVIEDCAQAYTGDEHRGHPESDVSFWSFGPIKTATALAGGVLRFRDGALCERVRSLQSGWPVQSRWRFMTRLAKYSFLNLLSYVSVFTLFVWACKAVGKSHDAVISASVRGFAGPGFFDRIRQQPSTPLLRLLERRFENFDRSKIAERTRLAQHAIALLPNLERPGDAAAFHSYWVFPVLSDDPERMIHALWARGIDATRGASSLSVVAPPGDRPETGPEEALAMFARLLYVPVESGLGLRGVERLARAVHEIPLPPQEERPHADRPILAP